MALTLAGCERAGTSYERSDATASMKGRPPSPDFFEPVDYVAWLDEQYGAEKPADWATTYSSFWKRSSTDEGMPDPTADVRDKLKDLIVGPKWERGDHPETEAYLDSIREYVEVFKREVEKPGYRFRPQPDPKDPRNPMLVTLPWTASSKYAVYGLLAESWRRGPDQAARMLETWRIGLRHTKHLNATHQLMLRGQATAIRLGVYDSIRAAASDGLLNADTRNKTLELLGEYDVGETGLAEPVRCEWGGTLGFVQALYPKGRLNRQLAEMIGYLDGKGGAQDVQAEDVSAAKVTPAELAAAADEHFVRLLELAQAPVTAGLIREVELLDLKNRSGRFAKHPLQPSVQPSLVVTFRREFRAIASARATRLILLLLQYGEENSSCPESLSEICQDERILTDPGSGERFVYRQAVKTGTSVRGFTLYSVGEDGVDNRGNHKPWGKLFGETEMGSDFVFWPLHERQ